MKYDMRELFHKGKLVPKRLVEEVIRLSDELDGLKEESVDEPSDIIVDDGDEPSTPSVEEDNDTPNSSEPSGEGEPLSEDS